MSGRASAAALLVIALSVPSVCSGQNVTESNLTNAPTGGEQTTPTTFEPSAQLKAEIDRCGEIIDTHLHEAMWFRTAGPLLADMDGAGIYLGGC